MGASTKKRKVEKERLPDQKELRQMLIALETQCNRALNSLDCSCEALRLLEIELDEFLDDYYHHVGSYFEQIAAIEAEIESLKVQPTDIMPTARRIYEGMDVLPKSQSKGLDQEIKNLYRDMAKEYHPDAASGAEAVKQIKEDVIKTLNDAYARKNLGDLWRLRFDLEDDQTASAMSTQERIELLTKRVTIIENMFEDVERRRLKLEESPACALMQRAFQMRLCGQNFIESVIADVKLQIERKQTDLLRAKLKNLYMEARRIREDRMPETSQAQASATVKTTAEA